MRTGSSSVRPGSFLFVIGEQFCSRAVVQYILKAFLHVQVTFLRVQAAVLRAQTAVLEAARTESRCFQTLPNVTRSSQKPLEGRRTNFGRF